MQRDEIVQGVKECIASALDLSAADIDEKHRLIFDLGADSLDMVDIIFQLEELGNIPLQLEGVYTSEALSEFRAAMPEVPLEEFAEGLTQGDFPSRLRVISMVNLVTRLRAEQQGSEEEKNG
jgi:acyl carrier protein